MNNETLAYQSKINCANQFCEYHHNIIFYSNFNEGDTNTKFYYCNVCNNHFCQNCICYVDKSYWLSEFIDPYNNLEDFTKKKLACCPYCGSIVLSNKYEI